MTIGDWQAIGNRQAFGRRWACDWQMTLRAIRSPEAIGRRAGRRTRRQEDGRRIEGVKIAGQGGSRENRRYEGEGRRAARRIKV